MLEIFRELRGLLHVSHVHIDSWVFRLHYSVTTTCMFAFSLIVSAKQYVGNPIDCIHTKDIPEVITGYQMINILLCCAHFQDVLNTYCWIHSTYTIPSAFWKRIGIDVAHPGIDKTIDPDERRYVKYYQWVCFCLFFQVRTLFLFLVTVVEKSLISSLIFTFGRKNQILKAIENRTNILFLRWHETFLDISQHCASFHLYLLVFSRGETLGNTDWWHCWSTRTVKKQEEELKKKDFSPDSSFKKKSKISHAERKERVQAKKDAKIAELEEDSD